MSGCFSTSSRRSSQPEDTTPEPRAHAATAPCGRRPGFLGAVSHIRRRAAPPKLIALNNAFLTATHSDGAPDEGRDAARFGAWIENACLASAVNQGQRVTYWREEPLEADGVLEGSWGAWAIEIKTARFETRDLAGVLEFSRRHSRFRPLIVTRPGDEPQARRLGLHAISWVDFLASGPGAAR
jgi:predicted AAA+ superfamily ATPase